MKREWYSWGRSSIPRPVGGGREFCGGCSDAAPPGCMGGVMQYLLFSPGAGGCVGRPPPPDAPHADRSKNATSVSAHGGLEAPRNSLELDECPAAAAAAEFAGDEQFRDIPIGIQIAPAFDALAKGGAVGGGKPAAAAAEAETPRTPSVVARLMGFDGLPEQPSPAARKPAKAKPKAKVEEVKERKKRVVAESTNSELRRPLRSLSCNVPHGGPDASRSLPDTPRPSTSARAAQESLPVSPASGGAKPRRRDHRRGRGHDENCSPSQRAQEYARELVKQAKETVAGRRASAAAATSGPCESKKSPSVSVEDKFVQTKPKPPPAPEALPRPPRAKPSRPPPPPPAAGKCKKGGCERFATRIEKPPRRTPAPPPPPALDTDGRRCGSSRQKLRSFAPSTITPARPVPLEEDPEYRYVRTVLERGGFARPPLGASLRVYSATAPVDPIIFHLLELELPTATEEQLGPIRYRWNRKLLFHLMQEIIADLLPETANERFLEYVGLPLLRRVWGTIRSFPAADCQVVGDIDALVAGDLPLARVRRLLSHPAVAVDEAGDVAADVADRVLGDLIGETAASLSLPPPPVRVPR